MPASFKRLLRMQPLSGHYFSPDSGMNLPPSDGSSMHPAVLQHLLQQQQLQQLALLQNLQGLPGSGLGGYSAAPVQPPQPLYAGTPLIQSSSGMAGLMLGPSEGGGRPVSASTSASSSVENNQPSSSSPSTSTEDSVRLHISNIPYKWRNPDLEKMFGEHGEVVEAEVIFNERGSKGFGFVTMVTKEGAEAARKAINGKEFERRIVEVNPATAKLSGKQKARVMQTTPSIGGQHLQNPHLQLAMLQQQALPAPDAQALALQQLLAAQAVLSQYAAQQQLLQGLQPSPAALQQQQWLQLAQLGGGSALPQMDLDKHHRRMNEELAKQQRYRPY